MDNSKNRRPAFPSTRWSLVIEAKDGANSTKALEELGQLYWIPLYAFARRNGLDAEDAEDLTQDFFLKLVEERKKMLSNLDPANGRLRSFFLTVMRRRIADWRRHRMRRKRGGGTSPINIDAAEALLPDDRTTGLSPESSYDHHWALAILQLALGRLERDFVALCRESEFALLSQYLGLEEDVSPDYETIARHFGITRENARQRVHRFRDRFRDALRAEVAETLHQPDEDAIDHELRELKAALRS